MKWVNTGISESCSDIVCRVGWRRKQLLGLHCNRDDKIESLSIAGHVPSDKLVNNLSRTNRGLDGKMFVYMEYSRTEAMFGFCQPCES